MNKFQCVCVSLCLENTSPGVSLCRHRNGDRDYEAKCICFLSSSYTASIYVLCRRAIAHHKSTELDTIPAHSPPQWPTICPGRPRRCWARMQGQIRRLVVI